MKHPAVALMAHYRMTSKYAHPVDRQEVEADLLAIVDPDFSAEYREIVEANLRGNYGIADGQSAREAVQKLLENASSAATVADTVAQRYAALTALAGNHGTAAFDYARAVEIACRAVWVDYLRPEEAATLLDGIAEQAKARFADWPQFLAGCLLGKLAKGGAEGDFIQSAQETLADMLLLLQSPARPLEALTLLPLGDTHAANALFGEYYAQLAGEPFDLQNYSAEGGIGAEGLFEIIVAPALQAFGIADILTDNRLMRMNFLCDGENYFDLHVSQHKPYQESTLEGEIPLVVFEHGLLTTHGLYYRKRKMVFLGEDHFVPWDAGVQFEVKIPWSGGSLDIYGQGVSLGSSSIAKQKFANEEAEKAFMQDAKAKLEGFFADLGRRSAAYR